MLALPAVASAKDYAGTALNIIPSGQLQPGEPPAPKPNDAQATMYDGLTPLFDNVTNGDLTTYFKSEALNSLGTDGPGTLETVPDHPGITITRDVYGVPHVNADTYDDGIFAAGWIAAEDRGLLLQQARYNARVAAIDAPGLSAIGLVTQLKSFVPSQQTEDVVAKQTAGAQGRGQGGQEGPRRHRHLHRRHQRLLRAEQPGDRALHPQRHLRAQRAQGPVPRRGRRRRGPALAVPRRPAGPPRHQEGLERLQRPAPVQEQGRADDDRRQVPLRQGRQHLKDAPGSVVLDHDSYETTPAVANRRSPSEVAPQPVQASNTLMITKEHSTTGNPLMVGGPQIGYFYPGLTYEIDMNAPGLKWRGATSAPFPGYLLIGRGEDFATTLTSASGDVIDQYAETLCGGSDTKYMYKGECREMGTFDAGTLNGDPVIFKTTVHGPVIGYATVEGKKVAISSKRSSYGEDVARPALQPPDLERPGARSEVVLQRRGEDPADVQLLLHRQQARRRVHDRQAADPPQRRRPGPARPRAPASTSGRAS